MRRRDLTAVLLLAVCASASGQPVITAPAEPVPVGGLATVRVANLAKPQSLAWQIIPAVEILTVSEWQTNQPILLIPTSKTGKYTLIVMAIEGETVWNDRVQIVIGPRPPPDPDDDEVDPIDPDDPDPPPPSGKRTLLIVRETADSSPAMRSLVTLLRTGENASYIRDKGHQLAILDDDSVDADGRPAAIVEAWRPHFSQMRLPVMFVLDQQSNQIVHKQELAAGATAADVMQILKTHGG